MSVFVDTSAIYAEWTTSEDEENVLRRNWL